MRVDLQRTKSGFLRSVHQKFCFNCKCFNPPTLWGGKDNSPPFAAGIALGKVDTPE